MSDFDERIRQMQIEKDQRVAAVARPRPEARAAAKWWADTIRTSMETSTGDGFNDGFASMCKAATGNAHKYPPRMIDCFEAELAAGIEAEIAHRIERRETYPDPDVSYYWRWYISIHVDYHPEGMLVDAAARAGMSDVGMFVFPSKTDMYVDRGKIEVSAGYGARNKVIWTSEEGLLYWTHESLLECRKRLESLNIGPHAKRELLLLTNAIESARPKMFDVDRPNAKIGNDDGPEEEFRRGMKAGLEVVLSLAGAL